MSALVVIAGIPVAALAIWLLLHSPLTSKLVAMPQADRWHAQATPTFGGIGIFAGFAVAIGCAIASGYVEPNGRLLTVLGGCALLFAAGFIDDLISLPPLAKLAAQIGAAGIVLGAGYTVRSIGSGVVASLVAIVWLVGITNAFNLLDNMDGLAGLLGGIAAAFFAVDALTEHPSTVNLVISLALLAGCLGFLPFNLRPRRRAAVFMGDSGSQMLGFALATMGLASSNRVAGTTIATFSLPLLILAIPILDTALVTVIRTIEGRPITQGGRDHTSHRLVGRGLSEKRAVLLLGMIAALLGATSLTYNVLGNERVALIGVILTFALLVQFALFLGDVQRAGILTGRTFLHRRQLIETLVDFALVFAAFACAYLLLLKGRGTPFERHLFTATLPALLTARYAAFIAFGLYRRIWRYAGSRDLIAIVGAVGLSELVAYGFLSWRVNAFHLLPVSIFVVDALVCALFVGAARFVERALPHTVVALHTRGDRQRALIVGAGPIGRSVVRELRETADTNIVGFIDDDPQLHRRRLLGIRILGTTAEIETIMRRTRPDAVLVTIQVEQDDGVDAIASACARAGVACRVVTPRVAGVRSLDLAIGDRG